MPAREDYIPVSNIKVRINEPGIKRVSLQPEGKVLEIKRDTEGTLCYNSRNEITYDVGSGPELDLKYL